MLAFVAQVVDEIDVIGTEWVNIDEKNRIVLFLSLKKHRQFSDRIIKILPGVN